MTTASPPQAPPVFSYTPDGLISRTRQLIASNKELIDSIVQNVSIDTAEFSNVLLPIQQAKDAMALELYPIGFLRSVSIDSKIRDAAASAEKSFSDHKIESSMREDVFKLVDAAYNKCKNDHSTLDAESRYLLEKEYKASLRLGLTLPAPKRDRLKEIKKKLPELYLAFSKNLGEENGGIWLTPEELNGVPGHNLEKFEKGEQGSENEGKLRVPFKHPNTTPIRKYCTVADTRKKVFVGNENKCDQNIALLEEAVILRDEAARLLGYPNHATFVLEDKMAKTTQAVHEFLDELRRKLFSGAQKELHKLKELKHADTGGSDHYYLWDHPYYNTMVLSRDFQLDENAVAEYFPLQACMEGILRTFEELFGLIFIKVEDSNRDAISETGRGDDIVWHPDVELFSVWDSTDRQQNGLTFVGYVYFDLFPREGKFRGAANFTIQPGFSTGDGKRQYPATALVCNFARPTAKKPALLKHNEVTTMFHELGHGIHNLVSETLYGCFHGTYTTRDFVEAPSIMLENWCWISSSLKAFSKHWSYLSSEYEKAYMDGADAGIARPEEKMSEAMIQSLINTRRVNDALSSLSSVSFALFDLAIHSPQSHEEALKMDVSALFNEIRRDVSLLEDDLGSAGKSHGAALLSHVMAGYDAVLYVYLWSDVYAEDMFRTSFGKNPMDKHAGRRFRNAVLKPGGSRDPMELLKDFLGREPSIEAFYQGLGIA